MTLSEEGLNWYGWFYPLSGYGYVNLEYATAIERLTGKVNIVWERRGKDNYWKYLSPQQQALMLKPPAIKRVGIIKTTPSMFRQNVSKVRIGYTMVENTIIGKPWVEECNKMHAILVPSKYLVKVFSESGVKVPVVAVKQGVDTDKFTYWERNPNKEKFIFGTCSYIDDRKNWQAMVIAFMSEFGKDEPVELWLKNTNPKFGYWQFKDERIKLINTPYTTEELNRYYHELDCFLFPSRAEGAGMPPREAMATGLPVIMTNWSGLADVCNPKYNYPLKPISIDVKDPRGVEQPGFQARIDIAELMYHMRETYEHRQEAFTKGKLASEWIKQEWTWDKCASDLLQKVEKLV
jgi:glycosyltransferase involved in cell wall biosynthesis